MNIDERGYLIAINERQKMLMHHSAQIIHIKAIPEMINVGLRNIISTICTKIMNLNNLNFTKMTIRKL